MSKVLHAASLRLRLAGCDTPRLDAELLACDALNCSRTDLISHGADIIETDVLVRYHERITRRVAHEPVAYIIGQKQFYGGEFCVEPGVLIPRPDTEMLVVLCLDRLIGKGAARCLDIGAGTGCVAISVLHHSHECTFDTVDTSQEALQIAQHNAKSYGVASRLVFYHGSLYDPLPQDARYDVILSNPPYIPTDDIPKLDVDVRLWEPAEALDGGADGLDTIRAIVRQGASRLTERGILLIEIGFGQVADIRSLCAGPGLHLVAVHNDLAGIPRVAEFAV